MRAPPDREGNRRERKERKRERERRGTEIEERDEEEKEEKEKCVLGGKEREEKLWNRQSLLALILYVSVYR